MAKTRMIDSNVLSGSVAETFFVFTGSAGVFHTRARASLRLCLITGGRPSLLARATVTTAPAVGLPDPYYFS